MSKCELLLQKSAEEVARFVAVAQRMADRVAVAIGVSSIRASGSGGLSSEPGRGRGVVRSPPRPRTPDSGRPGTQEHSWRRHPAGAPPPLGKDKDRHQLLAEGVAMSCRRLCIYQLLAATGRHERNVELMNVRYE